MVCLRRRYGPAGRRSCVRTGLGAALIGLALILCWPANEAQARSASIVIDYETGRVLQENRADARNYPASMTKMMTLYLAFEALERGDIGLDQRLPVSRRAAAMPPSKLGLKAGETIGVKDALLALTIKSANDAAVVVAEALGRTEGDFARLMSHKARALGMYRTSFQNASGLPHLLQLSTARDIAVLARALIRDFPQYYGYFSSPYFVYKGRTYWNHNRLLRTYRGADGIKTGYIRASGYNLAASARRNGRRLIAVVFGGKSPGSRDRQIAALLDGAFARLAAHHPGKSPGPSPRKPLLAAAAETTVPARQGIRWNCGGTSSKSDPAGRASGHVSRDGRLTDLEAELEEFPVNPRCAPEWVLRAHLPN